MFRIESYITSIILSYFDRYIKNFRQQDAQVSLWEGDGSFQNLNLDLEVLEEELNLPFSFVSGHIHELLLHVPWTRLTSEPVQITINTIECVMKLKPVGSYHPHARHSRRSLQAMDDPQSQSSLVSSLVNKIICNVSVTCNNLILKYVEEDIVLSMNIKTLSFGTVNNNWEPAFMELNATQLELRKVISLSDVTVCLDKRNASGRIESYLEPLLYRCFITIRLWQSYLSVSAKRAHSTRLDVLCEQMAFTVSEPQLPMLMRLMSLCLALHRKQFSQTNLHAAPSDDTIGDKEDTEEGDDDGNPEESWSSWAFGWMPTLIPLADDGEEGDLLDSNPPTSVFNFGFYVDTFTLALKLCEADTSGGMKTQSQAFMHLLLNGCKMDLLSHNADWTNVQMGICQATVKPDGECCCGVSEALQMVYLSSGSMQEEFLSGSLFDKHPSKLQERLCHSWKYHLESVSEAIMLEKTPAFAVDYLSCNQDKYEDSEEDSDDEDSERLPAKEKVVIRYVAGPVVIRVCSGLIHRLQMLMKACNNYDYVPYTTNTTLPAAQDNQVLDLVHRLSEKRVEMDEDLYSRYLPVHTAQFTVFNTIVELYPANHLPVHYSTLGRKLSRTQRRGCSLSPPPCVILECQCVYATLTRPLYPDKILLMASKFHKDRLPPEIMNTSLTKLAFKAVGVGSSLRLPFLQAMKVVEMSSVSSEQSWHSLITPLEDTVSSDIGLHVENVTTTSSKAKLILLCEIVSSLIATNNRQRYIAAQKTIYNTSLLQDAATTTDTIFLKLVVEHVKLRRVVTALCTSTCVSIAACQLFAVRLPDKGDESETMIVSAPDTDSPVNSPLLDVLYQQPVGVNQFPPILTFSLREVRLSTDPLLYSWLLYTPSVSFPAHQSTLMSHKSTESLKSRKVSESSLSSYMRRAPTPHESAPSSSERETLPSQPLVDTVPLVPLPDKVASLYPQWKTMIVYGDISQVSIYLPNSSLASPCPLTMEEGLQAALCQTNSALQVLVVKLPSVSLRCSNHKQGLEQFTEQLPVRLPPNLWSAEKDNFPWTVTIVDLHCYTMHGATTLPLLKPVSFNCTIGTAPKFSDPNTMISLALCVHLDTTPVSVNISEEQVVLIVSLIMAQWKVVNVLMPSLSVDSPPTESSLKLISSDESSNVTQSDELGRGGGPVKVKLTGWLQWTLVRTTLSMYSKPSPDQLKLTLDVEDVILSLDVERVYHKVKLKVATASVYHYTRPPTSERWKRGVFHGLVMRGYDPDDIVTNHSGDSGFLMATVTRAKCNNFHSRLGSPTKHPALSKKTLKSEKFITEIEIKMQPLDFVLSPTTIGVFVQVLDPLLCLLQAPSGGGGHKPSPPLHSSSLPLLYLDLNSIRVVLPMSRDQLSSGQPDVLLIQFHSLTANPHPENPLCRSPLRPDIYHKGEKQRTLNIPGSELEDRQYQFSIYRLCVETGLWSDLKELFVREEAVSSQHQNPALDWNEGRSPMFQVQPDELTAPLVRCFSLNVVVAPAMIYMDKDIVCGHAVEINAVSDITVFVTLDQLELCVVLASEMMSVLCLEAQRLSHSHSPPSVTSSTTRLHLTLAEHDSGIDTESSFSHIRQADPNLPAVHAVSPSGYSQASGLVHSPLPSSIYPTPTPLVWPGKRSVVPCEVLITGSSIKVSLMSVVREKQNTYEPLCFTLISQPHTFICRNTDNILTVQMSAFDVGVKCGVAGHTVGHWDFSGWGSKVFLQTLLESRSGEPHPLTGIPPSAVTIKVVWDNDKPPKIDFDMGRPIRIVCTLEIIEYLKRLQTMIYSSIFEPLKKCPNTSEGVAIQVSEIPVGESTDHYLRKLLRKFSKVAVKTQQIVLVVKSSTQAEINSCAELCVSVGGCEGHMTSTLSLQHAANGVLHLDTVTISTHKVTSPKAGLLLSPWQLIVHTSLCWDSWVSSADPPQVSISADSDILSLHLSPEQLTCLQALVKDYYPLLSQRGEAGEKPTLSRANSTGDSAAEEQYYHDDLQAGAFQFVDAANERGREEPPLTYQVVFWQSLPPAMAWRYPQPRAITKFCVMPIPFMESDDSAGKVVDPSCTLQYYSDTQASYQDYATFSLSQTSAQTVELAQFPPRVVATTWRVVINRGGAVVPVQALAASVRVDSYFSPALIPAVQVSIGLTAVQLSLWTQTDRCLPLPEPLNRYYLDRRFPEEHDFFTAVLEQANIAYSVWPKVSRQLCVKGRVRVNVLNYHTLSSQCCMSPCPVVASCYTTADCRQYSLVTGHCNVRLGPALSHSLAASLATWHEPRTQVLYTPYVVCNNTCFPLRFRQAGSDEYILLQVFSCHLYSWRTTKHPMKMEFGLMWFGPFENNAWSKSLYLRPGSSSVVKLSTSKQEAAFIVTVKQLTPTVCQVVIDGQLSLYNQLSLPVDVFMVPDGDGQPSSLLVAPGATSPSVVLDPRLNLNLKVRFSKGPAPWSGDIPLRPHAKLSKQWEVKLPMEEKGQFRSVWCNVIFNTIEDIHQILVVFSPLYTIKSLLPCQANVVVDTPALSASQVVPITGKGTIQQLDTPGLSSEKHNITFQLDCKVPASSPPVSLHYNMLDGSPAPPSPETEIASLLPRLQCPAPATAWPYLGEEWAGVEWISTTQPDTVTNVRVKFSEDVVASNTLLVEVQPWALLINTLGSHVYLQGRERTLCSLAHRAVLSPPPLESTFQIGVELENSVQLSDSIQLKRGPGFEMPHIPGLLPLCGFINITVTGQSCVCYMNVTSSEVSNLRLIHVRSSYVIASLSNRDLLVSAIAVKPSSSQYNLTEEMLKQPVSLRAHTKSSKPMCQPLTEWRVIGDEEEVELVPYLVIQVGGGGPVSCPVRLPGGPERHSVPVIFPAATEDTVQEMLVMTVEQVDGQTHLLLWDQPHPQLTLHNHTHCAVIFAKAKTDNGGGFVADCDHIKWQMSVPAGEMGHYSFPNNVISPETVLPPSLPPAVIAVVSNETNEVKWSDPVVLTQCTGRLLSLLGLPDMTLTVTKRGYTTHITLSQASHTEILAVDIRGQLTRQLLSERRLSSPSHSLKKELQDSDSETHETTPPPSIPPSENETGKGQGLEISCYLHGLTTTLLSHSELGCECHEVAALTVDHVGITVHPHPHQDLSVREMKIHTTVGDIQLDNQEFSLGGYDFPVVLLMQKPRKEVTEVSMSQHAHCLVDKARKRGCGADLTVVVDVNSHASIAVQDVSVKLAPLQIYIEDKYIYHLKECILNTLPSSFVVETPLNAPKTTYPTSQRRTRPTPTTRNVERNAERPKPKHKLRRDEESIFSKDNLKKDLSEEAEEDLFNVSDPEDNQSLEEISAVEAVSQAKSVYETDSVWTVNATSSTQREEEDLPSESGFPVPPEVLSASRDLARPLRLRSLSISELDLLVSIHTSTKFYIALDHSPLQLAAFRRSSLFTTAYRLGHSLTLHYFFGAIYGTGWALGSLELLGAPGGLARSLGLGLRDFISLPLQGMLLGPRAFFTGIAHGSASLMHHFAAGTITSVTRLAASWARTLDRLTLDTRDLERSEQLRRLRPQSLSQGVVQGLTEFGISLIGAISSIAHHPLQYVMSERPDHGLVSSVGLGLVGVITRPLSGVAELVALTGEGLLSGVGWTDVPRVRHEPLTQHSQCGSDSRLKYQWKLLPPSEDLLFTSEATSDCYEAVTLLVTTQSLYVVNSELDISTRAVRLGDVQVMYSDDPTLVALRVQPAKEQAQLLSQIRILEYVRESQRMLIGELSHISPSTSPVPEQDEPHFQFFVNPQVRSHFLAVLHFAKSHATNRGFSVIS